MLDETHLTLDTINSVVFSGDHEYPHDYVLAFMNSKIANWYMKWVVFNRSVLTMHFDSDYIGRLPIPIFTGEDWQLEIASLSRRLRSMPVRKFRKGVTNIDEVHGAVLQEIDDLIADNVSIPAESLD